MIIVNNGDACYNVGRVPQHTKNTFGDLITSQISCWNCQKFVKL